MTCRAGLNSHLAIFAVLLVVAANLLAGCSNASSASSGVASAQPTATTVPTPTPVPSRPTATPIPVPTIAGFYDGTYRLDGLPGIYPMQMRIFQSGYTLSGTTTEGSTVYSDTGTIDTTGTFSITETIAVGSACLSGFPVSVGHLSGTWSRGACPLATALGTWDVWV